MRELEFLPQDYVRARLCRRLTFVRSWLLVALGLAMVLLSLQMGTWVRRAQAELVALRSAETAVEPDCEKVRMLEAEVRRHRQRAAALASLKRETKAAVALAAVADALPVDVVLDELCLVRSAEGGGVALRLVGTAPTALAISRTVGGCEDDDRLAGVALVEARGEGQGEFARRRFVIEARLVAGEETP